ncbi:ATPase [Neorickettsia sennetsu]|uniref:ATPase F0, B chain n=1 Tax=Ehrlichia sennetsu (strain ATCC VR-367 / Miyayama) TaxID=222891 RepID=Q2GE10_EHRS3|nr:ATPase [Neorickettsia sennetsu]ABD46015.1 putative ATPase F0, B chain [Neorickettsia sennetsu str. Miyayama]
MSVESVVIGFAFFTAFGVLAKPVFSVFMRSLAGHSGKIEDEMSLVEKELLKTKNLLATAMRRNSCLNNEVERIITDAKARAAEVYEEGKCKAEEDLSIAIDRLRARIKRDNRDLMMNVKLSVLEGVFECLAGFGGKSLEKAAHEALVLHMAERLSMDLSPRNEQ